MPLSTTNAQEIAWTVSRVRCPLGIKWLLRLKNPVRNFVLGVILKWSRSFFIFEHDYICQKDILSVTLHWWFLHSHNALSKTPFWKLSKSRIILPSNSSGLYIVYNLFPLLLLSITADVNYVSVLAIVQNYFFLFVIFLYSFKCKLTVDFKDVDIFQSLKVKVLLPSVARRILASD